MKDNGLMINLMEVEFGIIMKLNSLKIRRHRVMFQNILDNLSRDINVVQELNIIEMVQCMLGTLKRTVEMD